MLPYRGIVHFHSRFSYDSLTSIGAIVRFARSHRLDFLILTDHGGFGGGRALQRAIADAGLAIEVPLAAEYCTEHGDVIGAFLKEEVVDLTWGGVCRGVADQGGLILLPHPFSHRDRERADVVAVRADLIEVFNSCCSAEQNQKAEALAASLGKRTYGGSDAHFYRSLGKCVLEVARIGSLKESLMSGEVRLLGRGSTSRTEVLCSQLIKGLKSRDMVHVSRVLAKLTRNVVMRV